MTAVRLSAALLAALVLAPAAHARSEAPKLSAPGGLRAFLLKVDEPKPPVESYERTPSFAWKPVPDAIRYEFQLSTSDLFRDNGIVYRNRQVRSPAIAPPIALPWITGRKDGEHSLYARVRAVTRTGTTPWTEDYGFDLRWKTLPEQLTSFDGLLRWKEVEGATGYQVWFQDTMPKKVISTATNVADVREYYTFHQALKWTGTVNWRVRAVRKLFGTSANALPAVSYGPWTSVFHTFDSTAFTTGRLDLLAAASDTITDSSDTDTETSNPEAHGLMPGFAFEGDTTLEGERVELYRVYAFSDRDCVNVVFRGSVVGSPAFAPRTSGMLKLPVTSDELERARNKYLPDLGIGSPATEVTVDRAVIAPNENLPPGHKTPPAEEEPVDPDEDEAGTGDDEQTTESASQTTTPAPTADASLDVPPVELSDTKWPQGGYYWTVVGVKVVTPEPVETTLAVSAATGAEALELTDAAGLARGNELEIGDVLPEVVTIATISGDTVTLTSPTTSGHAAGDEVRLSDDALVYEDVELPQDACGEGRVLRFGKLSRPVVSSLSDTGDKAPLISGLSTAGRLRSAKKTDVVFYGSPLVAWKPAGGAHAYEVQWSSDSYPFDPAADPIVTYSTSAVLPLKPGTWYYRVRGLNLTLAKGAQPLSWSETVKVVVAKPRFKIVTK